MKRLYGINVDKERWEVNLVNVSKAYLKYIEECYKKNPDYYLHDHREYELIDKKCGDKYQFNCYGIEQVDEDEFLVLETCQPAMYRYKLENSKVKKLHTEYFTKVDSINNDKILFTWETINGQYRINKIYSIRDNKIIAEGRVWRGDIEVLHFDNSDNAMLYVETELDSSRLGDFRLLYTVNPDTLEPISDCYSELRDTFIKAKSMDDIENIRLEDQKYISMIEDHIYEQKNIQLHSAKEKILTKLK